MLWLKITNIYKPREFHEVYFFNNLYTQKKF